MKYICKICGKGFDKKGSLGGHMSAHSLKAKEWYKKSSKLKTLEKIIVKKFCEKCGTEFKVKRTVSKEGTENIPSKESRFCSRKCANGHVHTEETKKKISLGTKGIKPWNIGTGKEKTYKNCKTCGKKINSNNKYDYCENHFGNCMEFALIISENMKKQYKNGKEVLGGTTKWYTYKNFRVQGSYEYRTCFILDKMLENKEILFWEKTRDRIQYKYKNAEHWYLIDFKLIDLNNVKYYIETKGYVQEKDYYKWDEADRLGLRIDKWFIDDIKKQEERLNIVYI